VRTKLLAVGLLLCCLVVGLGSTTQREAKKWEYRTEDSFTTENANQLGLEGWELVLAVPLTNTPYQLRYIYKRPRQ
jgi:hypothetical protein